MAPPVPGLGSGASYGGEVTAASGGGEAETSAGACDSGRAWGLDKLLRSVLSGQQNLGQQARQRPARRGQNNLVCFSCGKAGHGANCCPTLNELFPFMLPGCRVESTPGGYLMISPRMAEDRRRTENGV